MTGLVYSGLPCAAAALCAIAISTAVAQPPAIRDGAKVAAAVGPRQPIGILSDHLGKYLTIEGVLAEGGKVETNTLLVDTVDSKKLAKPILLVVRGAYTEDHNLRPGRFYLPAKQRCVIKGYESGEMIGVAPAVEAAAKEQGWKEVPMSSVPWQWRSYFVALIVVEPRNVELRK